MLIHLSMLSRSEGEAGHRWGIWRKKSTRGRGFWSLRPLTLAVSGEPEFVLFWTLITSLGLGIWTEEMKRYQFPRLCPPMPEQAQSAQHWVLNLLACITQYLLINHLVTVRISEEWFLLVVWCWLVFVHATFKMFQPILNPSSVLMTKPLHVIWKEGKNLERCVGVFDTFLWSVSHPGKGCNKSSKLTHESLPVSRFEMKS